MQLSRYGYTIALYNSVMMPSVFFLVIPNLRVAFSYMLSTELKAVHISIFFQNGNNYYGDSQCTHTQLKLFFLIHLLTLIFHFLSTL